MSATNHTQNYDLSQFVGGDIPSWLGDYNSDMGKIDSAIAEVASGAGSTASEVNSLKSRMTAAEADIDAAESNIATLQSTEATQGAAITQNTQNITTANNNISALDTRVTALENASGSGLDLTAHEGSITITPTIGTLNAASSISYHLNDDKSMGKIFGGFAIESPSSSDASDWKKLATLSGSDLPTRTSSAEMIIGFEECVKSDGVTALCTKLIFNTDGTIDVYVRYSGSFSAVAVYVNLSPCILLLNEGI